MSEKIVLEFGDTPIPWKSIRGIETDGEKKLKILCLYTGFSIRGKYPSRTKTVERTVKLRRLVEKEEFIETVKNNCIEKGIPFHEAKAST